MRSALIAFVVFFAIAIEAGELQTRTLRSEALGRELSLNVLLPDGYQKEGAERYPVIYLLHGYGGDYREWERVGVVAEAAGLPVIVAMPEGDKSFYVNHHEDPQGRWEDYIVTEVVRYVDQNYRTVAAREGRGISGLSMGGYGAMVLGLRHPDVFASVASHSGALGVPGAKIEGEIGERIQKIYGPEGSEARKRYDLAALGRELAKEKRPDLYIDCGSQDFLLGSNRALVADLGKGGWLYEYRETPGGHSFDYWKRNVRYSLSHQLAALTAQAAAAKAAPVVAAEKPQPEKEKKEKPARPASLAGEWDIAVDYQGSTREYTLKVLQKDQALGAVLISSRSGEHPAKAISLKDGLVRFEIDRKYGGQDVTVIYEAKLDGDSMSGTVKINGAEEVQTTFTAKRKKPESL